MEKGLGMTCYFLMILASDSGILEVQIHSKNSDPKMAGGTARVIGLLEASKHRNFYSQVFHSQGLGNRFVGRRRWNLLHVTVTAVAARGFSKRSLLSVTRRHLLEMTQITEPWIHCAGGSLESTKQTKGHNLPGTSL